MDLPDRRMTSTGDGPARPLRIEPEEEEDEETNVPAAGDSAPPHERDADGRFTTASPSSFWKKFALLVNVS